MLIAVLKSKFIVLFIIISSTFWFPMYTLHSAGQLGIVQHYTTVKDCTEYYTCHVATAQGQSFKSN